MILNGEIFNTFPLRLGKRQACLLLTLLFHNILEVLLTVVIQEKEIKDIKMGGGNKFISLQDIILMYKNSKEKKTLRILQNNY